MAHLCKNCFPVGTCDKLKSCKYMPFRITRKTNDNAYVVELSDDMLISNTFNVADLFKYYTYDPLYADYNSMTRFSKVRETDVGHTVPSHTVRVGLINELMENIFPGISNVNKCLSTSSSKDRRMKEECDSTDEFNEPDSRISTKKKSED